MLHRTEGIVITAKEYGEADLIVTFLTKDHGLIRAFAKSPRKAKSRFGSSLEPLTHSRISFWGKEHASLPRLTQADIISSYQRIRESYACFMSVAEILDLLLKCAPERDVSPALFSFLIDALKTVEAGKSGSALMLSLKIKLLTIAGFGPKLKGCGKCNREGTAFHFQEGAVLCDACTTASGPVQRLTPGTIRLYETLSTWGSDKVHRIKSGDLLLKELTMVIDSHIKYYISRGVREGHAHHPSP